MKIQVANRFIGELSPDNKLVMRDDGTVYSAADLIRMKMNKLSPPNHKPNDVLSQEYYEAINEFWSTIPILEWCKRCLSAWISRKEVVVKCPKCYSTEWQTRITENTRGRPRSVTR